MKRIVLKYPLGIVSHQIINTPSNPIVLSVQEQHGLAHVWIEVDAEGPPYAGKVEFIGALTGQSFEKPPGSIFRGTVLTSGGGFVTHYYELVKGVEESHV